MVPLHWSLPFVCQSVLKGFLLKALHISCHRVCYYHQCRLSSATFSHHWSLLDFGLRVGFPLKRPNQGFVFFYHHRVLLPGQWQVAVSRSEEVFLLSVTCRSGVLPAKALLLELMFLQSICRGTELPISLFSSHICWALMMCQALLECFGTQTPHPALDRPTLPGQVQVQVWAEAQRSVLIWLCPHHCLRLGRYRHPLEPQLLVCYSGANTNTC